MKKKKQLLQVYILFIFAATAGASDICVCGEYGVCLVGHHNHNPR
jgi:hypothetical protein